jgi:PAS domain S-box-containing protein
VPARDENGKVIKWYGIGHDVEDQKRAETALRESEYKLRQIIDTVPGLLWSNGPDGEPTHVSQRMLDYSGMRFEDFKHRGWEAFVHPADFPETARAFSHAIQIGTSYQGVMRLRRADGEFCWHDARCEPLRDRQGRIVQWYGLSVEIDEAKKAEDRLRRSEANLAEAQRLSHTGSWVINPASRRVLYWSEECYQIWGFDRVQGLPYRAIVLQRIHPDDRDRVHNETQEALRQKKDYTIEFRILLPDGTVKYLEAIGHHLFSAHGELVEVVGTNVDVTERKRAERVLRESEARLAEAQRELRQMIDTIPVLVVCYSTDARRDFVNAAWKQYTGLSDEAALGTDWSIVAHPDDFATGEKMWRDTLAKGEPVHVEVRLRRADGQYRWFAVERVALRDGSGKVIKWYATAYDIEDRMRAEDRLRRSRTYLDEAQRLSRTGSFGWHIADNLIVWSQETYRIFELDPAVKPTLELVFGRTHPDDSERVRDMIERVAHEDREFDFEHRLLLPDGTIKHLHLRAHRVRFESGEAEVVGALMDITAARKGEEALRRAQAELAHASRVATLGELSASIAHEVHQPLTAIVASGNAAVRWLDREVPENARAIRSVTRMISEAHRASQVILRIRELAKKAEPVMSQVDVNWLIEDVLVLISREATGQRVEVRTQLASELPPVLGDRVQLQQVLINLVMNGIQAMAPVTDRARVLVIRTQRPDANQILVAVEDAGVGIAPENLDRLFGAFYTTKPDGMGMGLSISRSIVETHGGSISATRNSGPGMTFQFTLSVYREQAASLRV